MGPELSKTRGKNDKGKGHKLIKRNGPPSTNTKAANSENFEHPTNRSLFSAKQRSKNGLIRARHTKTVYVPYTARQLFTHHFLLALISSVDLVLVAFEDAPEELLEAIDLAEVMTLFVLHVTLVLSDLLLEIVVLGLHDGEVLGVLSVVRADSLEDQREFSFRFRFFRILGRVSEFHQNDGRDARRVIIGRIRGNEHGIKLQIIPKYHTDVPRTKMKAK